ncbi:MAG: rod shape-determining protein MreD [Bacteroides sp.]|nr:rod shape-determining protein MreD [Bacteroides sp.]MCM1413125.1 rod shape-determining protein MreD [Bacteroides sp.]MCM1472133.1 rod shape-determining protein MreD [Bacteroides sp.]
MNRSAISLTIWTIFLVVIQVLVLNHVSLFGYAVIFVFIYTFAKLPVTMPKEWLFTIAFLIGLVIDIFSDTLGMNALTSTIVMALRRPVIRLYINRDDELSDTYPGSKSFGSFTFFKYVLTLSTIYCTLFFFIERFSTDSIGTTLLRIVTSSILTSLIIVGLDSLTVRKSEKRL